VVHESGGLLEFLRSELPGQGRNAVKSLLTHHAVTVDGVVTSQFDHPLREGQTVAVSRPAGGGEAGGHNELTRAGIRILFEDESIIVIEKPAGLLSISTDKGDDVTANSLLWDHVKLQGPGRRVFVVHRLDREASGIMMYAKTFDAKQALQSEWNDMVVERAYLVVVEGVVEKPEGTVTTWLRENKTFHVHSSATPEGGQKAVTNYEVIGGTERFTLLEVKLETGRKNQIRVHMRELGHSVVGDKKYGAKGDPIGRVALHAFRLVFHHPSSGEIMRFETQIPPEFLRLTGSGVTPPPPVESRHGSRAGRRKRGKRA
jgi:23S rRNA pseudouridine1911/1915/1917 synthase